MPIPDVGGGGSVTLAVDLAGGDAGVAVTAEACRRFLLSNPDCRLILVGRDQDLAQAPLDLPGASSVVAASCIAMDDNPLHALRNGQDSSLWLALEQVRDGNAAAAVSAGNTGAILALGCHIVSRLPGVRRPAMCAPVPVLDGHCHLLDLGANLDASAEDLRLFAHMGSQLCQVLDNKSSPRVAVLNIGSEPGKGPESRRELHDQLLQDTSLNYVGFIEGDSLFTAGVDVVVTDGFSGNIALKVCEGTARLVEALLLREHRNKALFADDDALMRAAACIDPDIHAGASLLGLNGVVVKSHGSSGVTAFAQALEYARREAGRQLPAVIGRHLQQVMSV